MGIRQEVTLGSGRTTIFWGVKLDFSLEKSTSHLQFNKQLIIVFHFYNLNYVMVVNSYKKLYIFKI